MTHNTFDETRIIADWDYWHERKAQTLSAANNQSWRKKIPKHVQPNKMRSPAI